MNNRSFCSSLTPLTTDGLRLFLLFSSLGPLFAASFNERISSSPLARSLVRSLPISYAMTLVDIFIIYLAFGSPVMVHRLLTNRRLGRNRRIVFALTGLAFWVPLVAQMGYRYLTNAYSKHVFVSRKDLDATESLVVEFRALMRGELSESGIAVAIRQEVLEALTRYVALSTALQTWSDEGEKAFNLYSAAETNQEIGSVCLIRRNYKHLSDHHIRAREDLLRLFQKVTERCAIPAQTESTSLAIRIAQQFSDETLVAELLAGGSNGENRSWPTHHQPAHQVVSTPLSALTITSTRPSSD